MSRQKRRQDRREERNESERRSAEPASGSKRARRPAVKKQSRNKEPKTRDEVLEDRSSKSREKGDPRSGAVERAQRGRSADRKDRAHSKKGYASSGDTYIDNVYYDAEDVNNSRSYYNDQLEIQDFKDDEIFLSNSNLDIDYNTILRLKNIKNKEINEIDNFINGEIAENKTNSLDFVYKIENNKNNIVTSDLLDRIIDYKTYINENKYDNLLSKTSMLFLNNKISKEFISRCFERFDNIDNIDENIKNAIDDKTRKVKSNSFEKKINEYIVLQNKSSNIFNIVTNNLKTKLSNLDSNRSIVSKDLEIMSFNNTNSETLVSFLNVDTYEKYFLVKALEEEEKKFGKDINTTSNDIIIQYILNITKSLYTLSNSCLIGNYKASMENNYNSLNFYIHSLKNIKSELYNFEIFKKIDYINNNINIDYYLNNKYLNNNAKSIIEFVNNKTGPSNIAMQNSSSIESFIDTCYLDESLQNFINNTAFDNFRDQNHIKNEKNIFVNSHAERRQNRLGNANIDSIDIKSNKVLVKDLNNFLYNGSFFNFNLQNYGNSQDTLTKIKDQIGYNNTGRNLRFDHEDINDSNDNFIYFRQNYSNNYFTIYFNKRPVTSYRNQSGQGTKGRIENIDNLMIDNKYLYNIDNLEIKILLDKIAKKCKLKNLMNKNVDLTFLNQIIDKIKNSKNKISLLSYCKSDKKNISVIDEESIIYNMLFTNSKEDNNVSYSHIDIVTDHKIDDTSYLGLDIMKKLQIEPNEQNEEIKLNIKNLISNYYPDNSLTCSSKFFYNVLNSLVKESERCVSLNKYEEVNLTQLLYFNYFNKNVSENLKIKNIIAERFLKKSVQLDTTSSSSFRRQNSLETFEYKINDIVKDDYDNTNKASMESYLDTILESSEKLKLLKYNIFSGDNLNNLV